MKYVYSFNESSRNLQELLGTKGQKLSDMNKMGLPVPYGFIISKTVSGKYYEENHFLDDEIRSQIIEKINELQEITGTLKVVLNGAISCDIKNLKNMQLMIIGKLVKSTL